MYKENQVDYYYGLSDKAQAVIPEIEKLLHGLTIEEVRLITARLKEKMFKESKADLTG